MDTATALAASSEYRALARRAFKSQIAHAGRLSGLPAAVYAAARAGHNFDEVIMLFTALHGLQHLVGIGRPGRQHTLSIRPPTS